MSEPTSYVSNDIPYLKSALSLSSLPNYVLVKWCRDADIVMCNDIIAVVMHFCLGLHAFL